MIILLYMEDMMNQWFFPHKVNTRLASISFIIRRYVNPS